jgi:protein SCO1/2
VTPRRQVALAAAAALAAGLGAATWVARDRPTAPPAIGGYLLAEPRLLPPVELVDENDERFTPAQFAGHWSFVYFGYTYCPDVCPLALLELAAVKERLVDAAVTAPVEYYLVSVDPRRDTPARLKEYVQYFDPAFHGLTGPVDALVTLSRAAESLFFIPPGQDPDAYLVSHSNNVILLNPAGELYAIFTSPHAPDQLATDFIALATHYAAR